MQNDIISIKEKKRVDIFLYLKLFLLFIAFFKATSELICSAEQLYDVTKSIGFWKGMLFLGVAIAIAFDIDYKNVFVYVLTAIYYLVAILLMRRMNLRIVSPELWEWFFYRTLALGTLIPSIVSGISKRGFGIPDKRTIVAIVLLIVPAIYVFVTNIDRMNMPFIVLIFVTYAFRWTEKKNKRELTLCLSSAIYVCILYTFIKSLVQIPYIFEINYMGIFSNSTTFSPFIGIGSACCISLFTYATNCFRNIKFYHILLLVISVLPLLFALVIINNRNAFVATALVFALFFFLVLTVRKKIKWMIPLMILSVSVIVLILLLCFIVFRKYGMIAPSNPIVFRLWKTALCLTRTKSKLGIIPDGSIFNPVDWVLSGRLSIWVVTVRELHIWKGNPTLIQVTPHLRTGVHNTFLGFLNMYGIVLGIMVVLSYCISLVYSFLRAKKNLMSEYKKADNIIVYFSALFIMLYCICIFMNEMFYIPTFYNVIYIMFISLICSDSISLRKKQN